MMLNLTILKNNSTIDEVTYSFLVYKHCQTETPAHIFVKSLNCMTLKENNVIIVIQVKNSLIRYLFEKIINFNPYLIPYTKITQNVSYIST